MSASRPETAFSRSRFTRPDNGFVTMAIRNTRPAPSDRVRYRVEQRLLALQHDVTRPLTLSEIAGLLDGNESTHDVRPSGALREALAYLEDASLRAYHRAAMRDHGEELATVMLVRLASRDPEFVPPSWFVELCKRHRAALFDAARHSRPAGRSRSRRPAQRGRRVEWNEPSMRQTSLFDLLSWQPAS